MVAVVGNMVKGMINNYKAKVEVFVKVYSEVIIKKNITFIRNQIVG